MKKKILTVLVSFVLFTQLSLPAFALDKEEITAQTAVLMDADTGQVLYDKNMDQLMNPASITKIMTGLLVAENSDMEEEMIVSKSALNISADSTSIWLQEEETITVDDALYALMVASANDSANVLAEHVAGTQEDFVAMMNARSEEIGAKNTHFENTHGLTSENHLTTAYDMALITREAIENTTFFEHFSVASYDIPGTNKFLGERSLTNHHAMLNSNRSEYDSDVIGGKTGFTNAAGNTLVTVAERDGKTLIAVVMKTGGIFYDTDTLLEYGFKQFEKVSISTESITEAVLPVLDDEQVQIGEATIIIPEEVEVLLINDDNPIEIDMNIEHPSEITMNAEEKPVLKISALQVSETIPDYLREIPLEYATQIYEPEVEEIPEIQEEVEAEIVVENPVESSPNVVSYWNQLLLGLFVLFAFSALLGLFVLLIKKPSC